MRKRLFAFLNSTINKQMAASPVAAFCGAGYANGYVAVPPSHPLHGKQYDDPDVDIDIHGGLTFSESMADLNEEAFAADIECIDFDNFDEIPKDYWVFGFDTMHYDDGPHLDREWCISETKDLMKQLENIKEL